jgi:hypothetical protein
VTKRRSHSRARDSLDSTSVPISSLLSRKPKDRSRDADYLEETLSPKRGGAVSRTSLAHSPLSPRKEDVVSRTSLIHSPDFARRLIPPIHENYDLHQTLMKLWIQKKIIEDDLNEIHGEDGQEQHRLLVQQLDEVNQMMYALIEGSPAFQDQEVPGSSSVTSPMSPTSPHHHQPVQIFSPDLTTMIIWFLYEEDEISAIVARHMKVAVLVDKAVDIVSSRGHGVSLEQIELRHVGEVLLPSRNLSGYEIESEDVIEILIVSEVQALPEESSSQAKPDLADIPHLDDDQFDSVRHDIFVRPAGDHVVPRDIFQSSRERLLGVYTL